MPVISTLNSNMQVVAEVVSALKAGNKVRQVAPKNVRHTYIKVKNKQTLADLFWDQIQNNEGMIIDFRA